MLICYGVSPYQCLLSYCTLPVKLGWFFNLYKYQPLNCYHIDGCMTTSIKRWKVRAQCESSHKRYNVEWLLWTLASICPWSHQLLQFHLLCRSKHSVQLARRQCCRLLTQESVFDQAILQAVSYWPQLSCPSSAQEREHTQSRLECYLAWNMIIYQLTPLCWSTLNNYVGSIGFIVNCHILITNRIIDQVLFLKSVIRILLSLI